MGEESKENLDYYDIWTIAVWTILNYRGIWNIAVWTTMTNFQTLYSSISSFLGLFKPLYKKIYCTVQNSLNGCSLIDGVVYLGWRPNFDSPDELVVQLE